MPVVRTASGVRSAGVRPLTRFTGRATSHGDAARRDRS